MCGIAGWFDLSGRRAPDRALLGRMNDALTHRGPDGAGLYIAPGIGLGHRRLAVIDLSTGAQPMQDISGHVTITFNGEIFNFSELKAELAALGHVFRTRSDTEVILEAWKEWGEDCVLHLSGQFAFALWDQRSETLFLARDRLGEKPLYYAFLPDGGFIFASELAGLLPHPMLNRQIDVCAIEEFFALGYIAEPRTIYAQVFKLPPASRMSLRRGQMSPRLDCYWNIAASPSRFAAPDEAADDLLARLEKAVSAQLVADVPVGAFLSGGVDSSLTTALMARQSPGKVNCFTIGFSDPRFDETPVAASVAAQYGAQHRVERLSGLEPDLAEPLARVFGEPFGDSSAIPCMRLMRLARQHVTVALSGDGGDELFAGYRRYAFHAREERVRQWLPSGLRGVLFGALGRLYPQLDWVPRPLRARQTFLELSRDTVGGYFANVCVVDDEIRRQLFSNDLKRELQNYRAVDVLGRHFAEAPFDDPLARAQYVDIKTWLCGDILVKVDRTAMANSLEVRVPMLDHHFVAWALNLPAGIKRANGHGKAVLKKAAASLLPDGVLSRPKQGFSVPLAAWFRGSLGAAFESDLARGDGLAETGYFDLVYLRRLLEQHRSGFSDHSRTLWLAWMFDKFLRDVHGAAAAESATELAVAG